MAMGLSFLGRGKTLRIIYLSAIHIVGAALGGAIVGAALGELGSLLSLSVWRPVIIAIIAVFALWQHLSRHPRTLGLHRQVPRKWAKTMAAIPCYFPWGMLLGSGIATVIPYSAFLLVLAAQLTSGVALGSVSGAIFGSTRAMIALLPLLSRNGELYPEKLFSAFSTRVRWLNTLYILVGGLLLVVMSWH